MRTNFVNGEVWDGSEVNALAAELNSVADTANDAATAVAGKATIITPEQFGAVGNGSTNDAVALQAALDALDETKTLIIESGKVYAHHTTLFVTTNGGTIKGGGEIRATNEAFAQSSFVIQGDHVTVEDILFTCPTVTYRGGNIYDHKITLEECDHPVLRRVRTDGSPSAGIFNYGTTNFLFEDVHVKNTRSDGIHTVNGATHGVMINVSTENTGDDGISVLGYDGGWPWDGSSTDIVVHGFSVTNSLGRGIIASGCTDVRFHDGRIDTTTHMAIGVTCEEEWKTTTTTDVVIDTVHVKNANTLGSADDRGSIFVANNYAGRQLERVYIGNIAVHDTNPTATFQIAVNKYTTGAINNLVLGPMTFTGTAPATRLWVTPGLSIKVDPSITNKPVASSIVDTNGNTILDLPPTASAVNFLRLYNRPAGQSVVMETTGSDTNVGLVLMMKGTGVLGMFSGAGVTPGFNADGADANVNFNITTKGTGRLQENGNIVGSWVAVPSTATSTGKVGQMAADASFLYICTATNTWRRLAIASW